MSSILLKYPLLGLVMAAAMCGLWFWRHSKVTLVAGIAWLLYTVYEVLMQQRVLCSGECNIRVDLLLLYPLLGGLTLAALARALWWLWRGRRAGGPCS